MKKCKIKSIKYIGKKKTYNLTMESIQHNYFLFDPYSNKSVISSNSHAVCYGLNSYITAYLKANYPDEFICSFLNILINKTGEKYDKVELFEKEFKSKMNVKFLERHINKCKVEYVIEKKGGKKGCTEIRPSLLCKGVGADAAKEIENKQPFEDFVDFVKKIDTSIVDTRVVESLSIGGYLGKQAKKNPVEKVKEFTSIRDGLKEASKRGVESCDIFE